MVRQYSPKSFFRQVSNHDLKLLFEQLGVLTDFDFEGMKETKIEPLHKRWLELEEKEQTRTSLLFREIHMLACERGIKAILEESRWHIRRGKYPEDDEGGLAERLAGMKDFYQRVCWVFRERPRYWEGALFYFRMDGISDGAWRKIKGLPRMPFAPGDERIMALEKALGQYYHQKEARGKRFRIEVFRWGSSDCYFCYGEDYAAANIEWEEEGFTRRSHIPAFEVLFRHTPEKGTLETSARGGRKVVAELQGIFVRHILNIDELPKGNEVVKVYDMEKFKHPSFSLDPKAPIKDVVIKGISFFPYDGSGDLHSIKSGFRNGRQSIHRSIQKTLRGLGISHSAYGIQRVDIQVTFEMPEGKKPRTKSFFIAWPNRCSLQHGEKDMMIRKMLERSGIELVDPDELEEVGLGHELETGH